MIVKPEDFFSNKVTSPQATSQSTVPIEPSSPNFFQKVGQAVSSRIGKASQQQERTISGEISPLQGTLRTIGQGAGAVQDVLGETIITAGKAVLPKRAEQAIASGTQSIIGSRPVQEVVSQYQTFKEKYPEASADIEAIFNISSLIPIGAGTRQATRAINTAGEVAGEVSQMAGRGLIESGEQGIKSQKNRFVQSLIKPIESQATKLDEVARTEVINGRKVVQPSPREIEIASIVEQIPTINSKNTVQGNYNALRVENTNRAVALQETLDKSNILLPKREVVSRLGTAQTNLQTNPLIVGDASKTANRLVEGAKKFINEQDGTIGGALRARKAYDNWVLTQKPKAFDAKAENAFTIANREVRDAFNSIIDEKIPDINVKKQLREQSLIYEAMDNIAPKAVAEANTRIGRAVQRIGNTLGVKNKAVQGLISLGLLGGGITATTIALPATIAGGLGYVLYRGGKFVASPQARKAVGELLEKAGKNINPKDKKILESFIKTAK